MGFLSRQSDPDEAGEPLGGRSIGSLVRGRAGENGGRGIGGKIVPGGERPAVVDTSRPWNEPARGGFVAGWGKAKEKAGTVAGPLGANGSTQSPTDEPKTSEEIQAGYENLFH